MGDALDPRSDIFSLGRVLYFLLCGKHRLLPGEDLLPLDELADAPDGLVRVVRKCTRLDPADRYQTIKQLLADLVRYDQNEAVGVAHPDVVGAAVDQGAVEPLLADFDPRRTEPVPPVILEDPETAVALDEMGKASTVAVEESEKKPARRRGRSAARKSASRRSEIAAAVGAGLVLLGIFASFLGGETGTVLGPIIAFIGAGTAAIALARRLK